MPYTNYTVCPGKTKGNRILLLVCLNLSLSSSCSAMRQLGNELFVRVGFFLAEALLIKMRLVPLWEQGLCSKNANTAV